jgi:hypothetical protein
LYLQDIDDDLNSGVRREDDETTSRDEVRNDFKLDTMPRSSEDYGDMHTNERPEDDDEEAVDKYVNMERIIWVQMMNDAEEW